MIMAQPSLRSQLSSQRSLKSLQEVDSDENKNKDDADDGGIHIFASDPLASDKLAARALPLVHGWSEAVVDPGFWLDKPAYKEALEVARENFQLPQVLPAVAISPLPYVICFVCSCVRSSAVDTCLVDLVLLA